MDKSLQHMSLEQMHCEGIWELTQIYFGAEISNWGSSSESLLIPVSGSNTKNL